jgi:CheY-like chemotaxis protein
MSRKSALVVDDSKSARFALRKYLESHSYAVETAGSAAEALQFLEIQKPEVIFLDHVMPGTDGFDALHAIKTDPQTASIPVVICSSSEGEDFNAQARARGAADVLQKPPSPQQLARVLDNLRRLGGDLRMSMGAASPAAAPIPKPMPMHSSMPGPVAGALPSVAPAPAPLAASAQNLAAPVIPAAPRSFPPPAAMGLPPAPAPLASKVSNIREPEAAIEQAVMKALRQALPAARAELRPEPAPAPARDALVEQRIKTVSQDFALQIAEVKASLSQIENRRSASDIEILRNLDQRVGLLERTLMAQMAELRAYVDAAQQSQAEQIAQISEETRLAVIEEAHHTAERAVMSAASRIAEQFSSSILKALGHG